MDEALSSAHSSFGRESVAHAWRPSYAFGATAGPPFAAPACSRSPPSSARRPASPARTGATTAQSACQPSSPDVSSTATARTARKSTQATPFASISVFSPSQVARDHRTTGACSASMFASCTAGVTTQANYPVSFCLWIPLLWPACLWFRALSDKLGCGSSGTSPPRAARTRRAPAPCAPHRPTTPPNSPFAHPMLTHAGALTFASLSPHFSPFFSLTFASPFPPLFLHSAAGSTISLDPAGGYTCSKVLTFPSFHLTFRSHFAQSSLDFAGTRLHSRLPSASGTFSQHVRLILATFRPLFGCSLASFPCFYRQKCAESKMIFSNNERHSTRIRLAGTAVAIPVSLARTARSQFIHTQSAVACDLIAPFRSHFSIKLRIH